MKNVTKIAKKSAGLSQKCSICPLMQRCTLEIHRACFDSFVEGFKKGARAAEKEINKKFKSELNMNQMNIELSKMQLIHLRNICKKGWGGYSKPSDDLEEMVKNGLLTKSAGPFGDVVYRPTDAGRSYINDFNKI